MLHQRALEGLAPRFAKYDVHHRGGGVFDLAVWSGDSLGLVRADEKTHYEALSLDELLDVLCALLSVYEGPA